MTLSEKRAIAAAIINVWKEAFAAGVMADDDQLAAEAYQEARRARAHALALIERLPTTDA